VAEKAKAIVHANPQEEQEQKYYMSKTNINNGLGLMT